MSVNSTNAVNGADSRVIIKVDARKDLQKQTFTSVWQGLQNKGYSESQILKITNQLEGKNVNGRKYDAYRVQNGETVDVTDAIATANVGTPKFGQLTSKKVSEPKSEEKPKPENASNPVSERKAGRINKMPAIMNPDEAETKYGSSKLMSTAKKMCDIKEGGAGYLDVTCGKDQHWCADGINYFMKELLGKNPFTNNNNRNLSNVSQIRNWAERQGIFQKSQDISKMKEGDVLILQDKQHFALANGKTRHVNARHTAVVVGVKDGKVLLLESNTNTNKTDSQGRFYLEKNGEIAEVNSKDGVMLKEYTPEELRFAGLTGIIDMSKYMPANK